MNRATVFLAAYRQCGNISRAAKAAGISRDMHHRRMRKDPAYVAAFLQAQAEAVTLLEDEATRRAVEGVERTKYFQGIPCGTEIEYSDSLLQFLLRGARPEKYRERHQVDVNANLHVTKFKGSMSELLGMFREMTNTED